MRKVLFLSGFIALMLFAAVAFTTTKQKLEMLDYQQVTFDINKVSENLSSGFVVIKNTGTRVPVTVETKSNSLQLNVIDLRIGASYETQVECRCEVCDYWFCPNMNTLPHGCIECPNCGNEMMNPFGYYPCGCCCKFITIPGVTSKRFAFK